MAGNAVCRKILLFTILLISFSIIPTETLAWDAELWYFPATVQAGSSTTFRVDIENTQTRNLGIFLVEIQFEWQQGDQCYQLHNSTQPLLITVGESKRFSAYVTIPSDVEQGRRYYVYMEIEAASMNPNGSWDPSDRSVEYFVGDIEIESVFSGGLLYTIICGAVAAVIGFLVVFILLTKLRKPQPPAYPYQQTQVYQQTPVTQQPQYRPPLYIPGSVTCPKCGASVIGNVCNICGKKIRRS